MKRLIDIDKKEAEEKEDEFGNLVDQAKDGDKDARAEILERLKPLLIASIRRNYNISNQYEDLIQDGNLMILKCLKDYDKSRGVHFLAYIKSSLRFMYLDKHKIKSHISLNEPVGDGDVEAIDLLVSDDINILDKMLEDENRYNLKEAMKKLTNRQKQIIVYYYIDGIKMEQIALMLGISYRTVVNTKTAAIEKLRKNIDVLN